MFFVFFCSASEILCNAHGSYITRQQLKYLVLVVVPEGAPHGLDCDE